MLNEIQYRSLFIADAGPQIGWGHYIRSWALAEELFSVCEDVRFFVRGQEPSLLTRKFPCGVLNGDICDCLRAHVNKVDIIVLDLYELSPRIVRLLDEFPVSVCIDDGSRGLFNCDILVNPNVNKEFTHRVTPRTKYLSGGKYILLRRQFDHSTRRKCKNLPNHLVIAFGGTDPAHLISRVVSFLKGADQLPFKKITALMGANGLGSASRKLAHGDNRFRFLYDVHDICSLMTEADIGLLSSGTLLYEAAVVGLPSLIVSVNDSQAREARVFHKGEAAVYLGDAVTLNVDTLMAGVKKLTGKEERQGIAGRAQALIDGQGRRRVAEAILKLGTARPWLA